MARLVFVMTRLVFVMARLVFVMARLVFVMARLDRAIWLGRGPPGSVTGRLLP
jgi:hypothetical protein